MPRAYPLTLVLVIVGLWWPSVATGQDKQAIRPEKVTVCQLRGDPAAYNQKLVEMTAFFSHGFEDSLVFDPQCGRWSWTWMEYGGIRGTGTMYCCPGSPRRDRPKPLRVEGIAIPLVDNEPFRQFDRLLHVPPDSVVHATVIGRFFAGVKQQTPTGRFWAGYGHLGCCSLFVVQQVMSVDPHDGDLDYRASSPVPEVTDVGCGYRDLTLHRPWEEIVEAQRRAEAQGGSWAFSDPRRVAAEELSRIVGDAPIEPGSLEETEKDASRVIYQWRRREKKSAFMVVVSRPYELSFSAKDPARVAWVLAAAYESSCENDVAGKP